MSTQSGPSAFPIHLLSTREREVLDFAVDGRTDEQIAQELNISVSTVNSYWVRIRGKLGPLSRTELVGAVLRHESGLRHADLLADLARMTALHDQARSELSQSQSDLRAMRGTSWHLLALDHMPEATLVCEPSGRIAYANLQAQHLFLADPGELEAMPLWDLSAAELCEFGRAAVESFFRPDIPPRMVIGVERPYYSVRRDGSTFRAILLAEKFLTIESPMATVTIREAMHDVEALVSMLRRPFVLL